MKKCQDNLERLLLFLMSFNYYNLYVWAWLTATISLGSKFLPASSFYQRLRLALTLERALFIFKKLDFVFFLTIKQIL